MKFTDFLKSLIPNVERDMILEDLRITRGVFADTVVPSYKQADELLKNWKFKSKKLEELFTVFARNTGKTKGFVSVVHDSLPAILENIDHVEDMITKNFTSDSAPAGLSYLKANLLQYASMASFTAKYSRKFLHYIYVMESQEYEINSLGISDSLSKATIEWLEVNFINFCVAFNAVTENKTATVNAFKNIPDILITGENEASLIHTIGEKKLDPFGTRLIPIWLNPIYHIGMFVAEWQANSYKAAVEERKCLQLRKLHLQRLKEGKTDAALEKEIGYLESRIETLNYSLTKIEDKNK